jgi:hypothetical protein
MPAMRRALLRLLLIAALVAAGGCGGGDDDDEAKGPCRRDAGVEAAARSHVDVIVVGARTIDAKADAVRVRTCRRSEDYAEATVTVIGVRHPRVADQRHRLILERKAARWTIVRDLDEHRCRRGRGHRDFSSLVCK